LEAAAWTEHLSQLAAQLNQLGVVWAAGASSVLYEHGLTASVNDLDILVQLEDAAKLDAYLEPFASKPPELDHPKYKTAFFREYKVNGVEIDLIAGFAIAHDQGVYHYQFDHDAIDRVAILNGVGVPIAALEDWYVLYMLMDRKENKVALIESHFGANGIEAPYRLEKALEQPLPDAVRDRIVALLNNPDISMPGA